MRVFNEFSYFTFTFLSLSRIQFPFIALLSRKSSEHSLATSCSRTSLAIASRAIFIDRYFRSSVANPRDDYYTSYERADHTFSSSHTFQSSHDSIFEAASGVDFFFSFFIFDTMKTSKDIFRDFTIRLIWIFFIFAVFSWLFFRRLRRSSFIFIFSLRK